MVTAIGMAQASCKTTSRRWLDTGRRQSRVTQGLSVILLNAIAMAEAWSKTSSRRWHGSRRRFKKAAEQGLEKAQYIPAFFYRNGQRRETRRQAGDVFSRKAAKQGDE